MELGLDYDENNLEYYEDALKYCRERFGADKVLVRRSSSGKGYHIRVEVNISIKEEMSIRALLNDCIGRRIADKGRIKAGLRSSRLFKFKSKTTFDRDFKKAKSVKIKKAGNWGVR